MSNASIGIGEPATITRRMDAEQVTVEGVAVLRERVQVLNTVFPIVDARQSVDLAPGASVDLDGTTIAVGKLGKLVAVRVSSSIAAKWIIKTRNGASEVQVDVIFTSGLSSNRPSELWSPPNHQFVTLGPAAGADDNFRVTVTNLDQRNAANVYATFYWDEADE